MLSKLKYNIFIFILFFIAFPLSDAKAINTDTLIKSSESTLYYYAANGKRYVFPNEKTYKSWFIDFSGVTELPNEELANIPLGGNVTYRPGIKMVKIQTDPKTYAVSKGGVLRWIKTEAVAEALYGFDWNKKIDDVPDTFFINYQTGEPIESASDYNCDTEMNSALTINDDKNIEKTASPLVSNTGGVVGEPAEELPEPEEIARWDNIRITEVDTRQQNPAIIALDTKYAVAWGDNLSAQDEINISYLNANGELLSGPFVATQNSSESTLPSIAKSSLDIGIVWEDSATSTPLQRDIFFMRVDEIGNRTGSEIQVTSRIGNSANPKIAWSGNEFGVVWWDPRNAIVENYLRGVLYYQRISQTGSLVGDNVEITTEFSDQFVPSLIWGNDEFAVAWSDDRSGQKDIYFVRFNNFGNITGEVLRITETQNDSLNPTIVWNGQNYGVAWQEKVENVGSTGVHYEIYYQKISSSGGKVGDAKRLTNKNNYDSEEPKIVLNNGKYGIIWIDYRNHLDKTKSDVYFMEINLDGTVLISEEKISDGDGLSFDPTIAVLNGKYVIVYADNRNGDYEIYSAVRK